MANGIRRRVLEITIAKNGCYLSQALSSAEILSSLYGGIMKLGASQAPFEAPKFSGVPGKTNKDYVTGRAYNGPVTAGYDRLLISPAHYAVAVYAALIEAGRLSPESLFEFNVDGSTVEQIGAEHSPGFELTTGSFGQAISQAGLQAAAFYKLDNLVIYVDVNGQQYDGWTKDVMNIEPISGRIKGFGAECITVNGHDPEALYQASIIHPDGKPLVVLCYTNTTQGIPELDYRKPHLHFVRLKPFEIDQFKNILDQMKKGER